MHKYLVTAALAGAACGGDDGGGTLPPCSITVGGDVLASDTCRMFLCYPRDSDYEALLLSNLTTPRFPFQLNVEVTKPTAFAAGTLTLDQMRSTTQLSVTLNDVTYGARQKPANGLPRTIDETASLAIDEVLPPSGTEDVCNGSIVGTLTATLVELTDPQTGLEAVGPGRATLSVDLGR